MPDAVAARVLGRVIGRFPVLPASVTWADPLPPNLNVTVSLVFTVPSYGAAISPHQSGIPSVVCHGFSCAWSHIKKRLMSWNKPLDKQNRCKSNRGGLRQSVRNYNSCGQRDEESPAPFSQGKHRWRLATVNAFMTTGDGKDQPSWSG